MVVPRIVARGPERVAAAGGDRRVGAGGVGRVAGHEDRPPQQADDLDDGRGDPDPHGDAHRARGREAPDADRDRREQRGRQREDREPRADRVLVVAEGGEHPSGGLVEDVGVVEDRAERGERDVREDRREDQQERGESGAHAPSFVVEVWRRGGIGDPRHEHAVRVVDEVLAGERVDEFAVAAVVSGRDRHELAVAGRGRARRGPREERVAVGDEEGRRDEDGGSSPPRAASTIAATAASSPTRRRWSRSRACADAMRATIPTGADARADSALTRP